MLKYVEALLFHLSPYREHYLFKEYLLVELRGFKTIKSLTACLEPLIQEFPEQEGIIRECIAIRFREIKLAYS